MEIEAIYENVQPKNTNRTAVGHQTRSQNRTEDQNSRRWFVPITACLVLFCVLLVISLIVLYIHLTSQRNMIHLNIAKDYDETLSSLKVNYSHLTDEKDQLQKELETIRQEKQELETIVKNFNCALNNLPGPGFVWYYISSKKKSWFDSRRFCKDHGADLVIINTEEEQKYISSLVNERVWIGLSDIKNEGNMKWVDNTPLNKAFWYQGEPNNSSGIEDCVEILNAQPFLNNWNDLSCSEMRKWICEK